MKIYFFVALLLVACSDASSRSTPRETVCKGLADAELRFDCTFGEARVLSVKQSADGFSSKDLDASTAETLGAYQLGLLREKISGHLGSDFSPKALRRVTAETILIIDRSTKIVQTKFYLDHVPFAVGYAGFGGEEFTRVLCLSYDVSKPVNLPGKCAQAVLAEFGFDIRGKKNG